MSPIEAILFQRSIVTSMIAAAAPDVRRHPRLAKILERRRDLHRVDDDLPDEPVSDRRRFVLRVGELSFVSFVLPMLSISRRNGSTRGFEAG